MDMQLPEPKEFYFDFGVSQAAIDDSVKFAENPERFDNAELQALGLKLKMLQNEVKVIRSNLKFEVLRRFGL